MLCFAAVNDSAHTSISPLFQYIYRPDSTFLNSQVNRPLPDIPDEYGSMHRLGWFKNQNVPLCLFGNSFG